MRTSEKHTGCLAALMIGCITLASFEPAAAQIINSDSLNVVSSDSLMVESLDLSVTETSLRPFDTTSPLRVPGSFPAVTPVEAVADDPNIPIPSADIPQRHWSIYMEPYSRHRGSHPDWHRMWINTAVLSGAFLGTLFVLEPRGISAHHFLLALVQEHLRQRPGD